MTFMHIRQNKYSRIFNKQHSKMTSDVSLVLWYVTIILTRSVAGNNTMCSRKEGDDKIVMFCCNNHQEINGYCEECKFGFTSKDGAPCSPCIVGRWGPKCTLKCRCKKHQRCDHISGCIDVSSSTAKFQNIQEEYGFSNFRESTQHEQISLHPDHTMMLDFMFGRTLNILDSTIPGSTHNHLNKLESTKILQDEMTKQPFFDDATSDAVLYIIPVGCVLTLCIILGILCICLKVFKKSSTFFSRSVQESQNQQLDNVYDLIDEAAMDVENIRTENNIIDEVINRTKSSITLSLETDLSQQEKSLYENVYQSLNTHPKKSDNISMQLERRLIIKPSEKEEGSDTDEELLDEDDYLKPICDTNSSSMNSQEQLEKSGSNGNKITLRLDTIAVEGYVNIMEQPVQITVQRTNPHFFFDCV